MQNQERFSLLRSILRTLGLSAEAVNDVVDRIVDFLTEKDTKQVNPREYPYHTREHFLSPAEQSFYLVLKKAASDWALICPKVALGDLFYAKSSDASKFRIFTNKIDRKHVDFLICDPGTVSPCAPSIFSRRINHGNAAANRRKSLHSGHSRRFGPKRSPRTSVSQLWWTIGAENRQDWTEPGSAVLGLL